MNKCINLTEKIVNSAKLVFANAVVKGYLLWAGE